MSCATEKRDQKTAKIYAFPDRSRLPASARLARLEIEAMRHKSTNFGDGWYHDDAIAEATDTKCS